MRKKAMTCAWCNAPIMSKDIIGINRKLIAENTHVFYCLPCFAEYCECTVEDLEERIEQFKADGCKLFQ